jgi:hypothetical protein
MRKTKEEVKNLLLTEYLHLLNEDMWNYILDIAYSEKDCVAHFVFYRQNIFYKDTYYLFAGTQQAFEKSMKKLRLEIDESNEIYKNNVMRDTSDELDDTPVDTFCSGTCIIKNETCPDKNGKRCECHWEHLSFDSENEYSDYIKIIYREGINKSYYNYLTIDTI